jgi:hypothetical protein
VFWIQEKHGISATLRDSGWEEDEEAVAKRREKS